MIYRFRYCPLSRVLFLLVRRIDRAAQASARIPLPEYAAGQTPAPFSTLLLREPLMVILPVVRFRSIFLQPFGYVWIKIFINQFHHEPAPILWSLRYGTFPFREPRELLPQFLGKGRFPLSHFVCKVC